MALEAGPSQMCTARPALARTGRASPAEEPQGLAAAPLPLLRLQAPLLQGRLPICPGPHPGGVEAAPAAPRVLRPLGGQEEKREAPCEDAAVLGACTSAAALLHGRWIRKRGQVSVWLEIAPDLSFLHGAPSLCPACARASPQVCICADVGLCKDAKSGAPTGFASVPFASRAPLLPVASGVREKGGSPLTSAVHLAWWSGDPYCGAGCARVCLWVGGFCTCAVLCFPLYPKDAN